MKYINKAALTNLNSLTPTVSTPNKEELEEQKTKHPLGQSFLSGLVPVESKEDFKLSIDLLIQSKLLKKFKNTIGTKQNLEYKEIDTKSYEYEYVKISGSFSFKSFLQAFASWERFLFRKNFGRIKNFYFAHISCLEFDNSKQESQNPIYWKAIQQPSQEAFVSWLIHYEFKKNLCALDPSENDSLRILHKEENQLTIDKYSDVLWFSCFSKKDQSQLCQDFFENFKTDLGLNYYLYRKMINRGTDPESKLRHQSQDAPKEWLIKENAYQILLKLDQGQSSGIFLDQRANRRFIKLNSKGKKVLNLFSYTCGFSLAAAYGGAAECISVDTSKASLEWGKENLRINNIVPEKHSFFAMETERFLKLAEKKGSRFDIIICDPPSFARNKKKLFKIENEIGPLLDQIQKLLSPDGKILFSLNFEKWTQDEFEAEVFKTLDRKKFRKTYISPDGDYEAPDLSPILKSILLQKV